MTPTLRARPCRSRAVSKWLKAACVVASVAAPPSLSPAREITEQRLTPVVKAVRESRPAVVSIQGQKTVAASADGVSDSPRQVNGMGTGTIVDERGYILTNFHVVSDVRRIQVTLDDGRNFTAELIANDSASDLAVIKIPAAKPLPVIRIGTSSDLMEGESVIALGNAFGYQQTVTRGIVSALGRDVQVSDTQSYDDLIQTDASINPGNSGGPLLNIDGEMIGVNVAVRAGAQGIGFAIPVDAALKTAASLLNVQRLQGKWHGLITEPARDLGGPLRVVKVETASPADAAGMHAGDEIVQIGTMTISRPLDLERALLDRPIGENLSFRIRRDGQSANLDLALASYRGRNTATRAVASSDLDTAVWNVFGLKLTEEPRTTFARRNTRYRGGMKVEDVRANSPASRQGIVAGDVMVGMHRWETASTQDIQYIVSNSETSDLAKLKFYILRGQTTLEGYLTLTPETAPRTATRR